MSSSAMELSILKLTSPRKRLEQSARFTFDNELALPVVTNIIPPKGKVSGSPPWAESNSMRVDDDFFTISEQHRATIPFKWEAIPGTRRDQAVTWVESQSSKDGLWDSEQEVSSASSPPFSPSPSSSTSSPGSHRVAPLVVVQSPTPEFQVNAIQLSSLTAPMTGNGSVLTLSDNSKPVGKGKILALKPPPGMHSIKQLLTLESEDRSINSICSNSRSVNGLVSSSSSNCNSIAFLKSHHRRSFRKDGLKALPFLSAPKDHTEKSSTTVLGFEEWSKVVQQQNKQEKQQQQETADIRPSHRRTMSMPRLSFSSRKKPTAEKENGNDFVDADVICNQDISEKGGLRECRPLSSMSSRTLADGYAAKTRNCVFDDDTDFSDSEMDTRSEYFDCSQVIAEEDVKGAQNNAKNDASINSTQLEAPKEKRKNEAFSRLSRFFKSSSRISGDHHEKPHHRPPHRSARLSSVSPALPPLAPTELKVKKASHHKQVSKEDSKSTSSPLLKMYLRPPLLRFSRCAFPIQ